MTYKYFEVRREVYEENLQNPMNKRRSLKEAEKKDKRWTLGILFF